MTRQSYSPDWFDILDQVEDRHFWFRGRRQVIAALTAHLAADAPPGAAVEIGCGNGGLLESLRRTWNGGPVIGMDLHLDGLRHARRRSRVPLVQADIHHSPLAVPPSLLGLFDVLEHLPDDVAVLRTLRAMLAPRGVLLLTVPAHMSLWSYFDEASNHQRRYSPRELREKLLAAGFHVEYLSQFMMPLFPLIWLARRAAAIFRRRKNPTEMARGELKVIPIVNELLARLLMAELWLIRRRAVLPFGSSIIAVARNRPSE